MSDAALASWTVFSRVDLEEHEAFLLFVRLYAEFSLSQPNPELDNNKASNIQCNYKRKKWIAWLK